MKDITVMILIIKKMFVKNAVNNVSHVFFNLIIVWNVKINIKMLHFVINVMVKIEI